MQVSDIQKMLDKAVKNIDEGKNLDEAESIINFLLTKDRNSQILWFYLATIFTRKKYLISSLEFYNKSLSIDDKSLNSTTVYNNIGVVYRELNDYPNSIKSFEKAIEITNKEIEKCKKENDLERFDKLIKHKADFVINLGCMYVAQGCPDKSLKLLNEGLAVESDHNKGHWNRSLVYLEKGEYEKGWKEYEFGSRVMDKDGVTEAERIYNIPKLPYWDGTKGQTVIIFGEQGIGDEIMFASILNEASKDIKIILDCHPRLVEIFRRAFPQMPVYGTRKVGCENIAWQQFFKVDAKLSLASLCKFYRNDEKSFIDQSLIPYISPDQKLYEFYNKKLQALENKPKIGISWTGGIKSTNENERHIPLEEWMPIFKQDVAIISLQYRKDAQKQIAKFHEKHPDIEIHHWQYAVDDYDHTAALVANLDLVISVPQSVVHLAGALGVETWQLCPKKALWQMGVYGKDMPWYSCVHNYWQDNSEKWAPVINKVSENLCNCIQSSIVN